jgi:hypothetical protein
MKQYLLASAAILSCIGLGFLLLIFYGVTEVAYFGVLLILLSLSTSLIYSWYKTKRDETVDRLKLDLVKKIRKDFSDTQGFLSKASDLIDTEPVLQDLFSLKKNLTNLGLFEDESKTDKALQKHTLTFIEKEGRKADQRLRSLEARAAAEYKPRLEALTSDLRGHLGKLQGEGYQIGKEVREFDEFSKSLSKSLREMLDKKEKLLDRFESIVDLSVQEATDLIDACRKLRRETGSPLEIAPLVRRMEEVKEGRQRGGGTEVIDLLVEVRRGVKDLLRDGFEVQRDHLLHSIRKTLDLIQSDHVDGEERRRMEALLSRCVSLHDPARLRECRGLEEEYKSHTLSILAGLHAKLRNLEKGMEEYANEEIWMPDEEIEDLVAKVRADADLPTFLKASTEALRHLIDQLDKDSSFSKVIQSFGKIEPIITSKLEEKGKVAPKDLNVKFPEKFLFLYQLKHPDTALNTRGTLIPRKAVKKTAKKTVKK